METRAISKVASFALVGEVELQPYLNHCYSSQHYRHTYQHWMRGRLVGGDTYSWSTIVEMGTLALYDVIGPGVYITVLCSALEGLLVPRSCNSK